MASTERAPENDFSYDASLCHASEDKAEFVDDLFKALLGRGLRVWYDAFEFDLGDVFPPKNGGKTPRITLREP